ncbi:TPA: hypothetical protein ACGW7B_004433 [Bacillus nitratireducens]|nr:hypothetical protein [Bacillus mobilis]HDR7792217.1 hypothetical protein [Bacillus luti]HDR7547828.1 hypothetical protein [Bacillus mobilis]HDR7552255.1 hypothetical protein [Bacillus mobilis]HDR7559727.1 hypothetical protein [Bacillus mobilis]
MTNQNTFNNKDTQIGAQGPKAVAHNPTFTMNVGGSEEITLDNLLQELDILSGSLRAKKEKNDEEKILLANILELQDNAQDKDTLLTNIKTKASKLLLQLATGAGAGIIAQIVSKAIQGN